MNKTKNDKYLRKNRHDKNSKYKSRKVQRGGKVAPVTNKSRSIGVVSQLNQDKTPLPPLPPSRPGLSLSSPQPNPEPTPKAEAAAPPPPPVKAGEALKAAAPIPTPPEPTPTTKAEPAQTQPPAPEAEAAATQHNLANFKTTSGVGYGFGEQIELPTQQTAAFASAAATLAQPQPAAEKAKTVPSSKPATQQPAPATKEELVERLKQEADNAKEMAEHSDPRFSLLAQTFPNWIMGKVSSVGHDSQVKLGEEIILTEFLKNIGNHIKQTKNQIKEVEFFNELLLEAIRELNKKKTDMSNDDLDKFNLYMRQIDYNNMFINKTLSDVRTTYEGAIKSGILQPMPEKSSSPGFFDKIKNTLKGNQKVPNEQNEKPGNEKPSITQRFKQGVSNMGKTVKNAATSAKGAVTSRFSRKNKNDNEDSQGIELEDLNNSNQPKSTQSTQSTPSTEPTPSSTKNPQVNNEGRFAKVGTATKEGFAKVKTAFSNLKDRFTKKNNEIKKNNYSALPDTDNTIANELSQSGGGNKTRKNRQYIREIKDNRAHLFNKEMEIINSIRNFKYGHIHEQKKQFMKAVKRS